MTTVVQEIKLDVGQKPMLKYLYAKQGDQDTRFVRVTLTAGEQKITVENNATAKIRALLPDGSTVSENAVVNNDGTITAELSDNILRKHGVAKADIAVISSSGAVLSSEVFCIKVQEALIL